MATFQIKQKITKRFIFLLLGLSAFSLLALMFASDNPEEFNRLQTPILMVNTVSFFVLFVLVAVSGRQLVNDYKKKQTGRQTTFKNDPGFWDALCYSNRSSFFLCNKFYE